MIDWKLIVKIFWPDVPKYPNTRLVPFEELPAEGLTMGTLFIGKQGSGKTTSLSRHIVEYFKKYPDRAIFILDSKGSNTDEILALLAREPNWETLSKRVVYDDLGNPEWVVPLPEFSHMYGTTFDEQAHRVATNLQNLAPELVKGAPYIAGLGLQEIAPQLFRIESSVSDDQNKTWQVTETRALLASMPLLKKMIAKYGYKVPKAKEYFEKEFFSLSQNEKELRTYAIRSLLGPTEAPEIRARLGYYQPRWTPREAIKNGLMVIVDGSRLNNRKAVQHYLFTQAFSLIMAEINKRHPADPNDKPVSLILDEVYSLFKIPSMAPEIAQLAPQYRSRKLQLYIVLQELEQMSEELRPHIWSLGNIVCFGISNFDEAYKIAQQLFKYEPKTIKMDSKSNTGQPLVEPDRGQYLQIANDLQRLVHRECIIRRYQSERVMEKNILWVKKTKDVPNTSMKISVGELKERLLRERGIRVQDALQSISERIMPKSEKASPPQI
jgi:type IV secretory system conjugative DNA transfer VirD4/TraG family protein